jgi:tetratricopeptide (TPR) repeat protein
MAVCLSLSFLSNGLAEDAVTADRLMKLGQSSYRQGGFAHALQYWIEAARLYEEQGSVLEQIKAQVSVAQALHQIGHYKEAGAMLTQAGRLAAQIDDGMLTATIKGRLSTVLFVLGENEQALQLINEALALAGEFSHPALTAALLNDQGNILTAEKRFSPAIDAYTESSRLAKASNQQTLMIIALINSAQAGIQGGSLPSAKVTLQLAGREIASAPDSYDAANAWLTLGEAYEDLLHPPPLSISPSEEKAGLDADILRHAAGSYWNAIQIAARIGDLRSESYGWVKEIFPRICWTAFCTSIVYCGRTALPVSVPGCHHGRFDRLLFLPPRDRTKMQPHRRGLLAPTTRSSRADLSLRGWEPPGTGGYDGRLAQHGDRRDDLRLTL